MYTDYNLHEWEFLLGSSRLPFYIIRVIIKIVHENQPSRVDRADSTQGAVRENIWGLLERANDSCWYLSPGLDAIKLTPIIQPSVAQRNSDQIGT